jgi:hypothetical protein
LGIFGSAISFLGIFIALISPKEGEEEAVEHEGEEEAEAGEAWNIADEAGVGGGPEHEVGGDAAEGEAEVTDGIVEDKLEAAFEEGLIEGGFVEVAQLGGDEGLVRTHFGGQDGFEVSTVDGVVGPEEGVSGVGVEQDEAPEAGVVVDGKGQDHTNDHRARKQQRGKGPTTAALAGSPPDPQKKEWDEEQEELPQEDDYAQG